MSAICQQGHPWRVPKQDDSVLAAVWKRKFARLYLGRFWFIDLKLCMRVFIDIAYKLKKKLRQSERVTLAFRKPGLSSTCEDHLFN